MKEKRKRKVAADSILVTSFAVFKMGAWNM